MFHVEHFRMTQKKTKKKIERKCSTWNTPLFLFPQSFDTIVKKGVAL